MHSAGRLCEIASCKRSSQQTVEQTEFIQEVVSPEIFKLNHSVIKKQGDKMGSVILEWTK